MPHDLSLHSGERQTATSYEHIRVDHRYRYEWADARLPRGGFGLDLFCGNGYGSWLLSSSRIVLGIDGSADAIRQAEAHFRTPRTHFSVGYYPFELPVAAFDFVVSLESIEHVADGAALFKALADSLKPGGTLIFSTPCEERLPHQMTGNHFHFKHYLLAESLALASSNGLALVDWAGQDTYQFNADGRQGPLLADDQMQLKAQEPGQFLILMSRMA
jgi:2-polyprenyl-3-methyl-5-hydroxy-6-metoxy-1,4-benzoquinol methylase